MPLASQISTGRAVVEDDEQFALMKQPWSLKGKEMHHVPDVQYIHAENKS